MLRTGVDLQSFDQFPAYFVMGDHAPNSAPDDSFGVFGQLLAQRNGANPTRITRVMVVYLAIHLVARYADPISIHHNNKVTTQDSRGKSGFMFPQH